MNRPHYIVAVENDECLKKVKLPTEHYAPFSMIGKMRTMSHNTLSDLDIFDKLTKVSKSSLVLFNELKLRLDPNTNLTCYPPVGGSRSEKVMYHKYIKELIGEGIIAKAKTIDITEPVPNYSYMINPYLVKPFQNEKAKKVWNILTDGRF